MTSQVERNISALAKHVALLESRQADLAEAIRTLEQLYDLLTVLLPKEKRRNGQRETVASRGD